LRFLDAAELRLYVFNTASAESAEMTLL